MQCLLRGALFRWQLRSRPFYSYVIQRTKYYDDVFLAAVYDSVTTIINVGCGSDTRAYRFAHLLQQKGLSVFECDQRAAILQKEAMARRRWPTDHVTYVPIDLNDGSWPSFETILGKHASERVLILMEGVSPYVRQDAFRAFLALLGRALSKGSTVAYDFKLRGVADGFGRAGNEQPLFRLSADSRELDAFHAALGYQVLHGESSLQLTRRFDPEAATPFEEDYLMRLVAVG